MFCNKTINDLWVKFLKEHAETAANIQDSEQPHTAPMLFQNNAPWEMRKARDSGCLCKDCESFHVLRRGVIGACASIDTIVDRIELSSVTKKRRAENSLSIYRSK